MPGSDTGLNPYSVLGVSEDADPEVVKAAYRRRVKLAHPDRHVGADGATQRAAEQEMSQLNWAWGEINRGARAVDDATTTSIVLPDPEPDPEPGTGCGDDGATTELAGVRRRILGWILVILLVAVGALVAATGVAAWILIQVSDDNGPERLTSRFELSDCVRAVDGRAVETDCGPDVPSVAMFASTAPECESLGFVPARDGDVFVCLT